MRALRRFLARLRGLVSGQRNDQRWNDEFAEYIALQTEENLRAGMPPAEARRQAILKFGAVQALKEDYREQRSLPFVENLLRDVRFAIRQLRRNPGFTCVAVLMLALGLCASVAIFAFVDATLIRPLPYRDTARLVGLFESIPLCAQCDVSYPDYLDWKKLNRVFSSMDAYEADGFTLRTKAGAERVPGARVTAGFFRTVGVVSALGRDFATGEDLTAAPRTVMLSYAAWQKRYGGKTEVLGQTVTLNDAPNIIIGVLPREFHFAPAGAAEFWTAFHATSSCDQQRSCHDLYGVARLQDGVSLQSASANMTLIAQQLEREYPDSNRGQGSNVVPLTEVIVGNIRPILIVLLSGAGLLLLIASVNVASLLLVRSESRRREIAVRSGLGASAARLISQFVTEALVLVTAATVLGLTTARWTMQLFTKLIPADMLAGMPYVQGLELNFRVLAFATVISLLAAVLFSLTPTLRLSLADPRGGLAEGSRGSAGTTWRRLGSNLVILELATAVVLLVGAGLLSKSLYRLFQVDIGLQPDHLATLSVAAPDSGYSNHEHAVALARSVVSRIAGLPGVESVAISSRLPLVGGSTMWIRVVGQPYHGEHNEVNEREVSSTYFGTLRARLLRGRYFTEADDASKPLVVIIDQSLAKKYFQGEDPIGKQLIYAPTSSRPPMEIVGVIDDIKEGALDTTTRPTMYVAFNQDPNSNFSIVVRTSQAERSMLPTLAATVHQIDPGISTFDERSMSDRINNSPAAYLRRCSAMVVGGFAALALLLSVVGLYGVIAYSVSQRTREIGIRIALGAQPSTVYQLILKEAAWLIAAGTVMGLVCSIAAATLMRGLLFGVQSWDASTLAAVALLLGISALVASHIPARRAASVNPVEALRAE